MLRATLIVAFCIIALAEPTSAKDSWVLWRRFVPADNPDTQDPRLWRAEADVKTKAQCESEVKEYRALPDKRVLDPAGRPYQVQYHCLPDTVDPREAKGK
jgi:hypothetical protein